MATTKKCACGCGGDVNPGRQYMHGHNTKKHFTVRSPNVKQVLKVKHRKRRSPVVQTWYAKKQVIKDLQKRASNINHLIELLQEVL